jgi:ABC-type multidrug transport system permease subunit
MKNLLYVIAGLLVLIWIIVFKPSSSVHLWLAIAALIVFIRIVFDKKLSNKKNKKEVAGTE